VQERDIQIKNGNGETEGKQENKRKKINFEATYTINHQAKVRCQACVLHLRVLIPFFIPRMRTYDLRYDSAFTEAYNAL
jgi:hypothetical protein